MALVEKGVEYELRQRPFGEYKREPYLSELHPFGMVPALEHGEFRIYETVAIGHYIDGAFGGVALQPEGVRARGRMHQIIGVTQAYVMRTIGGGGSINFYRAFVPRVGGLVDEGAIERALPRARAVLGAIASLMTEPFLCGTLSLADLYLAPILYVFRRTPEGEAMMATQPALLAWLERVEARASGRVLMMP